MELSIPPALNGVPPTPSSSANYAAIATSDDARYDTGIIEGGIMAATRFVFTVVEPSLITRIDVLWEGGANEGEVHSVLLWNAATGSFVLVGSQNALVPPDGLLSAAFTSNPSNSIDANSTVTVLVTYIVQGGGLLTDYVSVTVPGPRRFSDADCDGGLYCNGVETCVKRVCQPGTPPGCSNGIPCTIDSCNHIPNVT